MLDVGVSEKKLYGEMPSKDTKDRVIYPSLSIEKDIGDFKIGQKVKLVCDTIVTSLRKDKQSVRTTFEVREIGMNKKITKQEVGLGLAEDLLKKK